MSEQLTPDQVMDLQGKVVKANLSGALKQELAAYLADRRGKLGRTIGNMAMDPRVSDSMVRAIAARIHEINRLEQDLLITERDGREAERTLKKFWSAAKTGLQSLMPGRS